MGTSKSLLRYGFILGMLLIFLPGRADARDLDLPEGRWRIELQGVDVIHSKKEERDDDFFFTGNVEYEMPVRIHLTIGVRAYPLFYYSEPHPIYGVGAGLVLRLYQHGETYDGLYAEAGSAPIWHSHHFPGNSTRINFLNELGLGYKFRNKPWSISLKYQHISNASTGNDNAGVNGVSLGIGYTF
jgi:hypothetical protein